MKRFLRELFSEQAQPNNIQYIHTYPSQSTIPIRNPIQKGPANAGTQNNIAG